MIVAGVEAVSQSKLAEERISDDLDDRFALRAGVSKSRYFARSIAIKYSNFSRFYKKKGPFYKKFRCDKFCN